MRTVMNVAPSVFACVALLFIRCAPGINEQVGIANIDGDVAGFWQGLWHGVIAPITFIVSLFNHRVQIYEVHNNGGWYNFGFLAGIHVIFGGGQVRRHVSRRKRERP